MKISCWRSDQSFGSFLIDQLSRKQTSDISKAILQVMTRMVMLDLKLEVILTQVESHLWNQN